MRRRKGFDYRRWPVYPHGHATPPHATSGQWTAYIAAGGQLDAVTCHGNTREDALALRRHLLSFVPARWRMGSPTESPLVGQRYTCGGEGGTEFGFAFKLRGSEDTLFDIPLGRVDGTEPNAEARMRQTWKEMQWLVSAVCNAYPGGAGSLWG